MWSYNLEDVYLDTQPGPQLPSSAETGKESTCIGAQEQRIAELEAKLAKINSLVADHMSYEMNYEPFINQLKRVLEGEAGK